MQITYCLVAKNLSQYIGFLKTDMDLNILKFTINMYYSYSNTPRYWMARKSLSLQEPYIKVCWSMVIMLDK